MARRKTKTANLALQGGGSHGAFTWGAIDRLLEEEALEIEGVSATSAGAMNAAAMKTGLVADGSREAAKERLAQLWSGFSRVPRGVPNPLLEWVKALNPTVRGISDAIEAGPGYYIGDALTRLFSPYDLNPFNLNPLRDLLEEVVDFDALRSDAGPALHVCTTNVRTGKSRVFSGEELNVDVLLASACLPTLFQAVEIEDPRTGRTEAFWDGGYTGNPTLLPLVKEGRPADIVIVHVNPTEREETPRSAREILNRINEISFNASLVGELRSMDFVHRMIEEGRLERGTQKQAYLHSVRDDDIMTLLGPASKLQPDRALLERLHAAGREAAERFLKRNWAELGERSTLDLRALFED